MGRSPKFQITSDYSLSGGLICFLSGEPIVRKKDLTTEHYVPRSFADKNAPNYAELQAVIISPYNMRPAIKIINNIKGNLLPCEWEQQKTARAYRAIQTYKLDSYELALLRKLLARWLREPIIEPCTKCGLGITGLCHKQKQSTR